MPTPSKPLLQTAAQVAKAILELYQGDPDRWIQGQYATTWRKRPVAFTSKSAKRWCLMGACYRVTGHAFEWGAEDSVILDFRKQVQKATRCSHVLNFNDSPKTRFRDVLSVLRRIARPKKATGKTRASTLRA
jgi:hypothetical protein